MKLYKYQILIILIFSFCVALLQINYFNREDVTYLGQLLVLAIGIFSTSKKPLLKFSLCSLVAADIVYYLLVYKMGLRTEAWSVVTFSSFLYFLSFILMVWTLLRPHYSSFLRVISKRSEFFVIVFFLGIASYYILVPGIVRLLGNGPQIGNLSNIFTLTSSLPLAIVSYIFLTNTTSIHNQPLLVGFFILSVLDIGIQLETIKYGDLKFSYYDIFWFFGVLLISCGIRDFNPNEEYLIERKSIVNLVKKAFFLTALFVFSIFSIVISSSFEVSPMYFIFIVVSTFLIGLIFSGIIHNRISSYNESILSLLGSNSSADKVLHNSTVEFSESAFAIYKNISERNLKEIEKEKKYIVETTNLYRKMAHDISSPLSVLQKLSASSLSDEKSKNLLQQATSRVRAIAEDILNKGNNSQNLIEKYQGAMTEVEILDLLQSIVNEKVVEFLDFAPSTSINFECLSTPSSKVRYHANKKELSRVISNILNNSRESTHKKGEVRINVMANPCDEFLEIFIKDSGPGFPQAIINHDFETPISLGKKQGHGIGLFSASRTLKKWNGFLELSNHEGACVLLKLKTFSNDNDESFQQLDQFLSQ